VSNAHFILERSFFSGNSDMDNNSIRWNSYRERRFYKVSAIWRSILVVVVVVVVVVGENDFFSELRVFLGAPAL